MDLLFELVVESLWAPETYAKFLFLALTAPFWLPLAKVMYGEILPALNASEEGTVLRRQPGEDPFLSIPLASHRSRRAEGATRTIRTGTRRTF
jgi:hypothetical protein